MISCGGMQTWNNVQACKQCLCKFFVFGVNFLNVPAFYIENAQKGLCKAKFAKFACVNEKQYSISDRRTDLQNFIEQTNKRTRSIVESGPPTKNY